jgi:hypothetical protein
MDRCGSVSGIAVFQTEPSPVHVGDYKLLWLGDGSSQIARRVGERSSWKRSWYDKPHLVPAQRCKVLHPEENSPIC